MTAKRRMQKFGMTQGQNLLEQCRQLPGRLRSVCEDAARQRYARHYHPSNPFRRRHMVVDMVLALGLVFSLAAVAFITFVYQRTVQHQQIEVAVRAEPQSVSSGDTVEVNLVVRNNGRRDMTDAYLRVPAASGFMLSQTVPAMDEDGRIPLGTIGGNDDSEVTARGVVIGEVGSAARFNAMLHYRLNGLGEEEERVISESIFINGSHLSVDVELPESLALQKAFPFAISVRNSSANTNFSNVLLVVSLPPGWQTLESSQVLDPALGQWTLDSVGSLQTVRIEGRAQLLEPLDGDARLAAKVYAAPFGSPYLQDEAQVNVSVYAPNVAVRLRAVPPALRLGEAAQATVEVTNHEPFDLRDARLHLHVDDALLDAAAYDPGTWHDGYFDFALGEVAEGQTVLLNVPLMVRSSINLEQAFGANPVGLPWLAELHYANEEGQMVTVPLEERLIPFESDLSVSAVARYGSAEQETIGTGPWPPQAGERTTVWLFLQPRNQLNPVSDAVLAARLPEGVTPTGRQSVTAGQAVSVSADGRLTWRIGTLPDYKTAFEGSSASAAIEVEFVPANDDTAALPLLREIALTGRDTVANVLLQASASDIDVSHVLTK